MSARLNNSLFDKVLKTNILLCCTR